MGTAGAYVSTSFSFNYSFIDSATPSSFFATDLATSDVTVYSRSGSTTGAGAAIASAPSRSGSIFTFTLSTSEMVGDEVLLECSKTGMVSETISIALEPTPSDISEVQKVAVSSVSDFRATGFSTFDPAASNVTVGTIAANAVNASALATDAVTEIQSGLATSSALATAQTDLDTLTGSDGVTLATSQPNYAPNTIVPPTASAMADAVWDEARSLHTSAGSFGEGVKVESLNTQAKADVNAEADTAISDASLATASALSTAAAEISSILADTGTDGVVISTATANAIADAILKRNVSNTEATADEHTLTTIVLAILESARTTTNWNIYRSNGSTVHATKTISTDAAALPVVGVS